MTVAATDRRITAKPAGPHRIYEALEDEHDYLVEEFEGQLPRELRGTLYRNGPGRWGAAGQPLGQLFDGDGMLSMFVLQAGGVRYRNRYVRTTHYLGSATSNGVPQRGFGTARPGGPLANALRLPANVANTSVVLHAGQLLALWEGGPPHALDPDTLATLGEHDFDGGLRWLGAFSAHPKIDPSTGDLYNFGLEVLPRPMLRCYRVDTRGNLHRLRDIHIPEPVFNHDVALTERHMVFVIDPLSIDRTGLAALGLGLTTFDRALRYRPEKGTTIVLVPRDGSEPRVLQTDALAHFHVSNAYEDGVDTLVDIVSWDLDWNAVNPLLREFRTDSGLNYGGYLTRLRITPGGRVVQEELCGSPGEFPQYDWRRTGRQHRFSYLAVRTGASECPNAVAKCDHERSTERLHELPGGHLVSEPIFVPRPADAAEDAGWLLTVAYDPAAHRSSLLVLDAAEPERPAAYIGHLRHHVPQSFHGTFTRRIARPG